MDEKPKKSGTNSENSQKQVTPQAPFGAASFFAFKLDEVKKSKNAIASY